MLENIEVLYHSSITPDGIRYYITGDTDITEKIRKIKYKEIYIWKNG